MREVVAQTIVEDEGVKGIRDRLAKPKVQPIFSSQLFHPSACLDCLMLVQRVGGRSRKCSLLRMGDLPHTYSCTCFIQIQKKQK